MARVWEIGSSSASVGASLILTASGCEASFDLRQASTPEPIETRLKGMIGMPGMIASTPAAAETMPRLIGLVASWVTRALSAEPSTPALETRKPAAIETIRAGIWLTRPSPMLMMV